MMSESSTLTYTRRAFTAVKRELLDEFERRYLLQLLGKFGGDLAAVQQASRLSRRHLGMLVVKHGLLDHVVRGRRTAAPPP